MMIVQKHKHINGSVSYLKFKNGGYEMTVETTTKIYDPEIKRSVEDTIFLHRDRAARFEHADAWMQKRRKIW